MFEVKTYFKGKYLNLLSLTLFRVMHHFLPSLFCYLLHILFSFAYIIDIFICIRGSGLLSAAVFYQEKKPFLIKLGGFYIKGKTTSANKTASTFADEGTSNLILISLAFILLSFFLNVSLIFFHCFFKIYYIFSGITRTHTFLWFCYMYKYCSFFSGGHCSIFLFFLSSSCAMHLQYNYYNFHTLYFLYFLLWYIFYHP